MGAPWPAKRGALVLPAPERVVPSTKYCQLAAVPATVFFLSNFLTRAPARRENHVEHGGVADAAVGIFRLVV